MRVPSGTSRLRKELSKSIQWASNGHPRALTLPKKWDKLWKDCLKSFTMFQWTFAFCLSVILHYFVTRTNLVLSITFMYTFHQISSDYFHVPSFWAPKLSTSPNSRKLHRSLPREMQVWPCTTRLEDCNIQKNCDLSQKGSCTACKQRIGMQCSVLRRQQKPLVRAMKFDAAWSCSLAIGKQSAKQSANRIDPHN